MQRIEKIEERQPSPHSELLNHLPVQPEPTLENLPTQSDPVLAAPDDSPINVTSIEFDRSLANSLYVTHHVLSGALENAISVVDVHTEFLNTLHHRLATFKRSVYLDGGRQDYYTDVEQGARNQNGSSFAPVNAFGKALKAKVPALIIDPFLVADVYNRKPNPRHPNRPAKIVPGAEAEKINKIKPLVKACLERNANAGTDAEKIAAQAEINRLLEPFHVCSFDEYQFIKLYTQVQYAAYFYPQRKSRGHIVLPQPTIEFDYYSGSTNSLVALTTIFSSYPHLIPSNVKLRLHHYAGSAVSCDATIQGEGPNLETFPSTVIDLLAQQRLLDDDGSQLHLVDELLKDKKSSLMVEANYLRLASFLDTPKLPEQSDDAFVAAINTLENFVKAELENALDDMRFSGYSSAEKLSMLSAMPAYTIWRELVALRTNLDKGPQERLEAAQLFKERCYQPTGPYAKYGKLVLCVVSAAVGAFVGAVAGLAIGGAFGAGFGPGIVLSAVLGMFKGTVTGATLGWGAGVAVGGAIAAGSLAAYGLFSESKRNTLVNKIEQTALTQRDQARAVNWVFNAWAGV